jgi:TolB protein
MVDRRLSRFVMLALIVVACGSPRPTVTTPPTAATSPSSTPTSAVPALDPELADVWLAFSRGEASHSNIFVGRANGDEVRQVTTGTDFRYNPAWSPDGTRIAYRVEGPEGASPDPERDGIWVVNADGSSNFSLSAVSGVIGAGQSQPWSPDGNQVVMSGRTPGDQLRIWLMNADGSEARPLTPATYEAQYPAWSPDGGRIAFSAVIDGGFRLMIMNADGSGIRELTDGPTDNWPSWSPDGSRIVFGRSEGLVVMNADGSDIRTITTELGVPATWAPAETIAANCSLEGQEIAMCIVGQDGTIAPLLAGGDGGFPAWRPEP